MYTRICVFIYVCFCSTSTRIDICLYNTYVYVYPLTNCNGHNSDPSWSALSKVS